MLPSLRGQPSHRLTAQPTGLGINFAVGWPLTPKMCLGAGDKAACRVAGCLLQSPEPGSGVKTESSLFIGKADANLFSKSPALSLTLTNWKGMFSWVVDMLLTWQLAYGAQKLSLLCKFKYLLFGMGTIMLLNLLWY